MEAFSISCTTCGRRLRVRDPELIGQILACPKCHGMVLITPPAEVREEPDQQQLALGDGAVDSQAVTSEGIETRLPESPAASGPPGAIWESDPSAVPPIVPAASGTSPATEPLPHGHPVQWQSESSARARQIAGIVLLGLVCLVSAIGIFGFVVRQWQASRQAVPGEGIADAAGGEAQPTPTAEASPAGVTATDETATDEAATDEAATAETDPEETTTPETVAADASSAAAQTQGNSTEPGPAAPSPTVGNPADGSTAVGSTADGSTAAETEPGDALKPGDTLKPGDIPAEASAGGLFAEAGGVAGGVVGGAQEVIPEATELPAGLQQYMPLIDLAQGAGQPRANDLPAPPTMEDLRVDAPDKAIPESEYPPPAEPVDVRMRMQSRVLGIEVKDRPLDQVVRVLAQIGGVPIHFDLISLDIAGIAADTPIAVRVADQSAAVVLARAIDAAGCRMTLGDDGIVRVVPKAEALEAGLGEALSVSDFDGQLPITADELQRMIGGSEITRENAGGAEAKAEAETEPEEETEAEGETEPEGDEAGEGEGSGEGEGAGEGEGSGEDEGSGEALGEVAVQVAAEPVAGGWSITGPVEAKIRAALIMEGLRIARGMPPRLPAERTSRWLFGDAGKRPESGVDWQPIPEVPVSLDFDRPRAIEMIVGELAREQDAAAVVDWDSAWSHGLTPEASMLPWLRGRTAPQVLEETLAPFGLEAFAAGQGVWWVGTRDAYEQAEVVAVLATSLGANAPQARRDQLLLRVALAAGQQSPRDVAATIDEVSGKLIVRLPRYVVRELPAVLAEAEVATAER